MAQQYWIGGFYIDLSRNQITQNNESKKLAPKALSLLTYLARNQGKVVSQEELLAEVWQGSVVSPNTLQRSIAQLRKALGDDGKVQVYIKTHAKQGYSLECDVRWNPETNKGAPSLLATEQFNDIEAEGKAEHNLPSESGDKTSTKYFNRTIAMAFVTVLCAFITFHYFFSDKAPLLKVGEIRALTATDNKELAGIYSPDGKYVVFHRYSNEFCSNNIWAKNIETQQEFQLTQNLNSYGEHSFSKDGKSLVFVQSKTCIEQITQKKCYHLMSLDFEQALKAPLEPKTLLECKNSEIRKPQWLSDGKIALLQRSSQRWKLINYSIDENNSETIYQLDDGNIIDFDYSMKDDLLALFSIQEDGQYYVEMLTPNGQLLSSKPVIYPSEIAPFRFVYPNFSPFDKQLVFSTGKQLFSLTYDGQVNNISLPIDERMGTPVFHPDSNRMLAIKGQYDSDIVSFPLASIEQDKINHEEQIVIERTTAGENNGLFQPNGQLIGFQSSRSGQAQVWLTDNNVPRQLTSFPTDALLYEFHWASEGQSILVNADKQLTQVTLDGTKTSFDFEYRVNTLFDWDSENQTALSLVRIKGILKFVELNLTNSTQKILNDKRVKWASKASNGAVIFTDHMDRFWQSGPVEDQMIEVLKKQGSDRRFIINENVIYGINEDFELWSYSIEDKTFKIIGDVPKNIDYITDFNGTDVLMTMRNVARKEVVELLLTGEL